MIFCRVLCPTTPDKSKYNNSNIQISLFYIIVLMTFISSNYFAFLSCFLLTTVLILHLLFIFFVNLCNFFVLLILWAYYRGIAYDLYNLILNNFKFC